MPYKASRRQRQQSRKQRTRRGGHRAYRGGAEEVAPYLRFPHLVEAFAGKAVLVTGGAGFIGSNLVDALLAAGASKVRVLDNLVTGKRDNLRTAETVGGARFEFVKGDITDVTVCRAVCKGMDVVYHEAALVSVPISMKDPVLNNDVNITGTLNMLIAASEAGVKRFVFASSAATYGSRPGIPKRETDERQYPSPYALSKGVDEDYATLWASNPALGGGMTCVGLRYFNVYGPRQDPTSPYSGVISIFADRILKNRPVTFFGKGEQTRDFVFVADVVQANLLAGLRDLPVGTTARVYNVGTGSSVTLLELMTIMQEIMGKPVDANFQNYRPGNIMDSASDIQRIQTELQYSPRFTLKEGLGYLLKSE